MQWTGKYRNEYVFILYVLLCTYISHSYLYFSNTFLYCMYHLYFCTESNRFRADNAYKPTNVPSTDEHLYKIIVSTICMYTVQFGIYKTSIDARLWRASLLWRTVDGISVKAL